MTKDDAAFWLNQIKERYIKGGDEEFDRCRKEAIDRAIEALKGRKTGKWTEKDAMYICTACKNRLSKLVAYDVGGIYNYCPFCGAEMGVDA